jgi:tRNA (guanine-N7-)-methyltransferase
MKDEEKANQASEFGKRVEIDDIEEVEDLNLVADDEMEYEIEEDVLENPLNDSTEASLDSGLAPMKPRKIIPEGIPLRRVRSFVRRDGRMTDGQRRVLAELWPRFGLMLDAGQQDLSQVFGRPAHCTLEIGFGSGHSLLEIARAHPERDFIGIETYQPGIGTLLLGIEEHQLTNIRIYYADAVEVLQQCIASASLEGVQLFFPDPWPKRRHHKRRIIQPAFIKILADKLKPQGLLHLATDWEHYAHHMMQVLSHAGEFKNVMAPGQFALRSSQRPVETKFEQRGTRSGRPTWELQFERV